MRHLTRFRILLLVLALAVLGTACSDSGDTEASKNETNSTNQSIDRLVSEDPAHVMTYSPTRKTINFWIDTWNVPGQLAFTYIRTDDGDSNGYYVLDGPPVSMCAALTKTWTYEDTPKDDADVLDQRVPRRSIDGVYYSGGQCSSYYGKDASTGAYIEFSIGAGQNYFLSTQPLPNVSGKALGPTTAEQTECNPNPNDDQPDCKVR